MRPQSGPTLESLGRMVEVARHHKDSLAHDEETCEALARVSRLLGLVSREAA